MLRICNIWACRSWWYKSTRDTRALTRGEEITNADAIKAGISLGMAIFKTNPYAAAAYGLADLMGYNPIEIILGENKKINNYYKKQ